MPSYHRDDTAPSSVHVVTFVGTTDPADTPANNVAAHKLWVDTTGPIKIMKRNAGNTAWDVIASLDHADLSNFTTGDPHTQYLAKALGTTKGDILVYDGTAWVALPAGTDGTILTADSGAPDGVGWASAGVLTGAHVIENAGTPMTQRPNLNFVGFTLADVDGDTTRVTNPSMVNPMTTLNDLIVGGASGAPARMAKGADGQVLTVDPTTHNLVWATPGGGSGTVTSVAVTAEPVGIFNVAGSPVTGAGTVAITMDNQSANTFLAGPSTGSAAEPAFRAMVAADIPINERRMTIAVQFGDGANAIDIGTERDQWIECNFDGTIEGWSLLGDVSGSLTVDIWKDTYANYPPVVGDSITASATPALSSQQKNQSSTLTGWTTTITRGDVLKFHVSGATTVKAATLSLRIVKT